MRINEMMNKHIWYNKFVEELNKIYPSNKCYCKEKWWRFDITPIHWYPKWIGDKLIDLENESEQCCMYCGKHRKQIWIEWWRVFHICPICYVRRFLYIMYKKITSPKHWD